MKSPNNWTARISGLGNLHKSALARAIRAWMAEPAMSADEALIRLGGRHAATPARGRIARGNLLMTAAGLAPGRSWPYSLPLI